MVLNLTTHSPNCVIPIWHTPPKIKIDTQNDDLENVPPFRIWLFSVSMLVFGGWHTVAILKARQLAPSRVPAREWPATLHDVLEKCWSRYCKSRCYNSAPNWQNHWQFFKMTPIFNAGHLMTWYATGDMIRENHLETVVWKRCNCIW